MDLSRVERSMWIDAPPERVWQAISDPAQIAQWYLPPAMGFSMSLADDGTLSVMMGEMGIAFARLEKLDAPRQLTSISLPDDQIAATYTLEPDMNGTRVTVRLSGLESLSPEAAQERIAPLGTGWSKALENLKAFVEGRALPHQEGFVASVAGFRRETPQTQSVERSIWINAPRERVWSAITDPAQIGQWFSPGTEWRGTGLHVGGRISVYDPETDSDMYVQVIDAVDAPRRLVTRTEDPPPHSTIWSLNEEDGGTRLTLTHTGYENEPDDARHNSTEQNAFGFGMMLMNLKAQIEGEALPNPGGF
ncbi:MAG: SRPBCC domain-containing protein [Chloroflexota bacterium]